MGERFAAMEPAHRAFIERQQVFFTATATAQSRVNVSPREIGALRVLGPNAVIYLDRTGSGAETAAHLRADGRMTIMLCAFAGPPRILRLYGRGTSIRRGGAEYDTLLAEHYDNQEPPGARQMVRLEVDLVQTSCGYGVPLFDYSGERPALDRWAENKGPEGLETYRRTRTARSLDGLPTGFAED